VGGSSYAVPAGAVVVSPSGSDGASGAVGSPLRTLGRAIAVAGSGKTIVLRGGSYHESVVIPSDKRLTIQSWPGEAVWLDGSVPVSGWSASGGRWKTSWSVRFDHSPTYTRGAADNTAANWGFVNPAYPMAAHPDQVWVGGVAQRQMKSLSQVGAGSFFYDEANKTLWLGSNPSGTSVRASSLVQALRIESASSVVRGIGIRRYAPSVPDMGAVTVERPNVTVENVAITDSATTGLHVGAGGSTISGVTLRNLYIANSGMLGMSATYADGLTLDQVVSEHNNTEHFNTAPVSGGVKIARTRGITITNSVFRNNDGPGIWIDESSYNTTIDHNDVRNNTKHGIALEISAKAKVTNNTVAANGGFGIKVNNTSSVTLTSNTFDGNYDRSVNLVQDTRRPTSATTPGRDKRQPFPDPTMTWLLGPVTVTNNTIANQHAGTCMLCVEDYSQNAAPNRSVSPRTATTTPNPPAASPTSSSGHAAPATPPSSTPSPASTPPPAKKPTAP
jgi:parallel beta-helix repeat protein